MICEIELQGVPKKVLIKNFYYDLFTVSIHNFWNLFGFHISVSFFLGGVSFNRFGDIKVKLQQFFRNICVFQACKFSRKTDSY